MRTEAIDQRYLDLDLWPTGEALEAMLEAQLAAVAAVRAAVPAITRAVDAAADVLGETGRLIYLGAGTSGRIGVQDGTELVPTFDWPPARLVYLMAGGDGALLRSVEGAEDDEADGRAQIDHIAAKRGDVVIAVAASGATPFSVGGIARARERGALTIAVANNPGTPLLIAAEHAILVETGAEVIAGSTRMKAGTAQKVVLNMISTGIMVRLGRVYRGMMVNMRASNVKLRTRAVRIVSVLAACDADVAAQALAAADNDLRLAVLLAMGKPREASIAELAAARGNLREAIRRLAVSPHP